MASCATLLLWCVACHDAAPPSATVLPDGGVAGRTGGGASGAAGGDVAGGDAAPGQGDAPGPLGYYEYCLDRQSARCAQVAPCCGLPDAVGTCESLAHAVCRPDGDAPPTYDAEAAGRCVALGGSDVVECRRRRDSDAAQLAEQACAEVQDLPPQPRLGDSCIGACEQEPQLSVWCDTASDGAGSFMCEPGRQRSGAGGSCGLTQTCLDGFRCEDSRCTPLLADGAPCSLDVECASAACTCEDSVCGCDPRGPRIVADAECRSLEQIHQHGLVATRLIFPKALALDDTHVYFNSGLSLYRVDKRGALREQLAVVPRGDSNDVIHALAVDDTHVYLSSGDRIGRVAKTGGEVELVTLDNGMAWELLVVGDHLYSTHGTCSWLFRVGLDLQGYERIEVPDGDGNYADLFADEAHVLCASGTRVHLIDRETLEVTLLAQSAYEVGPLHSDGTTVHWINRDHSGGIDERHLMRVPKRGGSEQIVATTTRAPRRLHYDPARDRFYVAKDRSIERIDPATGIIEALTEDFPTSQTLAADADALYWVMEDGVVRFVK